MHIGVVGATGTIGSRVVTEALERGHHVRAFSRDASRPQADEKRENITWASVDVLDAARGAGIDRVGIITEGMRRAAAGR